MLQLSLVCTTGNSPASNRVVGRLVLRRSTDEPASERQPAGSRRTVLVCIRMHPDRAALIIVTHHRRHV